MFGKKQKDISALPKDDHMNTETSEESFKSPEPSSKQRQSSLSPLEEIGPQTKKIPRVIKKEKLREKKAKSEFTPDGHAIDAFMQENRHAEMLLKETRKVIKRIEKFGFEVHWKDAYLFTSELKEIEVHYRRKEELLFPKLKTDDFNLLTENFSKLHREVKKSIRNMQQSIKNKNIKNLKALFSQSYEMIHEGIVKEEQLLFPAALSRITEEEWKSIRAAGKSIGYSWIEKSKDQLTIHMEEEGKKLDGFRLESGFMTIDRIDMMMNALPVEITVVNEDDRIVYYNNESTRIFKRVPGFIGEKFIDCHTGRNEKTVKKIISNFKKQEQKEIELFFNMDDSKVYVKYQALFSTEGEYKGFVEIATDITYFRSIEGEKIDIL